MRFRHFPVVMAASLFLFNCSGTKPGSLGEVNGKPAPCPDSPNCVSTRAQDPVHKIEPLTYASSREHAMEKLISVVKSMKRAKIITATDHYLHAEFSSLIFRFVDDVQFSFDDETRTIHFRSASRLGYSDLGVNRKRMEEIRRRYAAP